MHFCARRLPAAALPHARKFRVVGFGRFLRPGGRGAAVVPVQQNRAEGIAMAQGRSSPVRCDLRRMLLSHGNGGVFCEAWVAASGVAVFAERRYDRDSGLGVCD